MKKLLTTFALTLVIITLLSTASQGLAVDRQPTFGVKEGETYTYKLEVSRLDDKAVNYTVYGEWVNDTLNRYVAEEGDTWTYTIVNTTVGAYDWWGLNATLKFGSLERSGNVYFWMLHDLWPWDFTGYLNFYDSVFQDIHSDNASYFEKEVDKLKNDINMSNYEAFDVTLSGSNLAVHIVPKDKSFYKEQNFEMNLEKGIVTLLESKMNSSVDWFAHDHVKIVCVTVPPVELAGSTTPGFELSVLLVAGLFSATIIADKRKKR